jgi:BlaI family penicillinase repressor
MTPPPAVSESEWAVLNILWKRPWLTAVQVSVQLHERDWKLTTVRTFLNRLEKKNVITSREGTGAKEFAATIAREALVSEESRSFLERVFEGATSSLLVHFARNKNLTRQEIAELRAILDRKEGGKR